MSKSLRELRELRALTQGELARLAGVSQDTVSELETGQRRPYPSTRRKLAKALKVRVEEIDFRHR